jgi:hypothetical protein
MKLNIRVYIIGCIVIACALYIYNSFKEGFQNTDIKFGVMAIFKNEAMGIREWIEHYKWQGADKILLLDNNSTDDWKDKIAGLEENVTVLPAPKNHVQAENYKEIGIPWLKENGIQLVATLDLDEYMFATDGKTLKQYVLEIFGSTDRPSQFSCGWTMFGSSGYTNQPNNIRASFTWKKSIIDGNKKSIAWVSDVREIYGPHAFEVSGKTIGCPVNIQVNHYAIQSREYFEKVKMSRGDVANVVNPRDWDYFNSYDYKEEEDTKLKDLLI